ncbi:hypothetical protein ACFPOI_29580 [Nonomuraea angiospora]|uniref:Uncharacterized protein n=1 Tax=Nonomuraea angiospora TaxID=46172 RepID=A0ABR9LU91_9ACTN|nr:hypothetical protein [Nonomuraea angiospora]MBE1584224.1 hypothetical protein [Nonomuraea angiospora]
MLVIMEGDELGDGSARRHEELYVGRAFQGVRRLQPMQLPPTGPRGLGRQFGGGERAFQQSHGHQSRSRLRRIGHRAQALAPADPTGGSSSPRVTAAWQRNKHLTFNRVDLPKLTPGPPFRPSEIFRRASVILRRTAISYHREIDWFCHHTYGDACLVGKVATLVTAARRVD